MTVIDTMDKKPPGYLDSRSVKERAVGRKELSKDDFMRIFLKQIKMQDPSKPFDSSAMLQQMAQLTSLSASEELDHAIKNLNVSIAKSQVVSTAQLIGRKVNVYSDRAPLVEKEGLGGSVIVPKDATNVTITIKDKDGKVVKTIDKGASGKGVVDFSWDGKDAEGNDMKADDYKISAVAKIDGRDITLTCAGTYKVTSIAMDANSGTVVVNIDGLGGIDLGQILKIL